MGPADASLFFSLNWFPGLVPTAASLAAESVIGKAAEVFNISDISRPSFP